MAMVSIKRTPEEIAERQQDMMAAEPVGGEEYPYGACIVLSEAELRKLGFTESPEAGTAFKIEAIGFVRRVESWIDGDEDDPDICCNIQITDMGMSEQKAKKSAAKVLYGGEDD